MADAVLRLGAVRASGEEAPSSASSGRHTARAVQPGRLQRLGGFSLPAGVFGRAFGRIRLRGETAAHRPKLLKASPARQPAPSAVASKQRRRSTGRPRMSAGSSSSRSHRTPALAGKIKPASACWRTPPRCQALAANLLRWLHGTRSRPTCSRTKAPTLWGGLTMLGARQPLADVGGAAVLQNDAVAVRPPRGRWPGTC